MSKPTIHTSYFKGKAPKERKVCIAKKAPRYFSGHHCLALAPSNPWAKNWQQAYQADLEKRFPNGDGLAGVLSDIASITQDPILCCYEKDGQDCHRRILAAYVEKHLNIIVPEWQP